MEIRLVVLLFDLTKKPSYPKKSSHYHFLLEFGFHKGDYLE
ncbi:hypothetical protein SJDPG12_07130 [Porphyromonas gingivalis SJD12]|nr:hypothetical protein SJDPG12_07130 [Porphyromonas gingivalis SJD12]